MDLNQVVHRIVRGLIVPTGYGTAGFAIKAGYLCLAAAVLVFVAMLVLTVLHP
jgi:hypothetical protein